jgi:hypothetical protein
MLVLPRHCTVSAPVPGVLQDCVSSAARLQRSLTGRLHDGARAFNLSMAQLA